MTSSAPVGHAMTDSLTIRPPRQRRSRDAWIRILDAGVALLESGGYEAFTIAAVCEYAQVPPRAIYARADSKDALFLAVYEHGMARVRADQLVFNDETRWRGLDANQLLQSMVREVAELFMRHSSFLRAVVLLSAAHPEVRQRGAFYAQELGEAFTSRVMRAGAHIDHRDAEAAARTAFNTVFSAVVLRVAYGPEFLNSGENEAFVESMGKMVSRYLLR